MRPPPWLPPAPQRLTLPRAAFRVHPASDCSDRLPRPGLSPFALSTRSLGPPSLPEVSCRDRPIPPPLAPEVPALPVLLTQRPAARRLGHPRARWPCSLAAALGKTRAARGLRASRPLRPQSSARPQDSSLPLRGSLPARRLSREAVPAPHREARPLPSRPGSRPPPRFSQARLAPGLTLCTCLSVSREPAGPSEQGRHRTSLHPQDSAEDRSWVFVDVK